MEKIYPLQLEKAKNLNLSKEFNLYFMQELRNSKASECAVYYIWN